MSHTFEPSYFTAVEETTSIFNPVRSYDDIVSLVGAQGVSTVSYGLFQATCRGFGRVIEMREEDINKALDTPWELYDSMVASRRIKRTGPREERIAQLGLLPVSDSLLVIFGPYGANFTLNVIVNQMTVQEIISCEKTRSEGNKIRVLDRFEYMVAPGNRPNPMSTRIIYHLIKFERIRNADLESILRAKASESPLLTLENVTMMLNPHIPNVLLSHFRTMNAIADWSLIQGQQGEETVPRTVNPSIQWSSQDNL